ncbi:DUF4870 domain-containing protein [Nocardioides sp.]|uniref:DUF4870 domain-containing protein n=1 Tax=Nocardioides sp. TaxID=35761 RepID=UPI002CC8EF32|nr:DUF4870 domain-containing protein [Nocardioides sp.]HXH78305.1 DUF4870 domain-containing protein [Nocardioides sp.]
MTEQFPTEPTNPYPAQSGQAGQQPPSQPVGEPVGEPAGQPVGQHGYAPQGGYGIQPKPISPAEERTLGAVAHGVPLIAMVLSAGMLGFVGSLAVYLMYKDRGPFVRAHAANSLNVQIITGIVLLVSIPLMFVLIGFLSFALALVYAFVVHLLGAIKANNGEWWDPPMTPKFVR